MDAKDKGVFTSLKSSCKLKQELTFAISQQKRVRLCTVLIPFGTSFLYM